MTTADAEHLEGVEGDLDVLERRHVERRDDHGLVGLLEHRQRLLVERRRRVDHDVVEHRAQRHQGLADQRRGDPLADVGVARCGKHLDGVLVAGQQRVEQRHVDVALRADRVLDRVGREQLQGDRDVTEGQVEVDQAHLAVALVGERQGEVDRDRGLADAALRREHRDDRAVVLGRTRATQRHRELVGPGDGTGDAVEVVESDDLPGAGLHGAGQRLGVEGFADQDHPGHGTADTEALADRHGIVEPDVRPQHHDVLVAVLREPREQPVGGVDGLAPGRQRTKEPADAAAVGIDDDRHGPTFR